MVNHATKIDCDTIEKRERERTRGKWLTLVVAIFISLIWILPFYYLAVTIFKSAEEYTNGSPLSLPQGFAPFLGNAMTAWTDAKMAYGMLNSGLYGLVGGGLAVFIAAMAAFGLTRLDYRGKNFWFMTIFAGTVFPFQMYLIPLFFFYQKLNILNTQAGMLLFYTAICIPFPTLVLKNFMNGMSREMDEAARMDGAGEFTVFSRIVLPNVVGPMTAVFLLQFTWIWNDLLFSTVLGNLTEVRSIMNSLQVFQGSYASAGPNIVLTAALIASVPSVLLFLLLRKHFMEGMRVSTL
ncbi:carbohydrate ABC transporter permease [Rhizobium sp. KVB221]|uniref:Carbohydrate ABC transporter permease n=1 Tax=Rhizobium setariae TaxID=2801340 RepID=A0A936YRQ9_9HYPH|nr:carbohydrate ABC transporter permease [Rhizobium setariae]MBL0371566.1 carbohydrate ABC transporter permease [Rhizobium setariae]